MARNDDGRKPYTDEDLRNLRVSVPQIRNRTVERLLATIDSLRSRLSEVEGERDTLATQLAALRSEIGRVLVDTCTLAGDTVWRSETQTLGEALAHLALPDVEHPLAVLFDEPGYAPDGWLDAFRSPHHPRGGLR